MNSYPRLSPGKLTAVFLLLCVAVVGVLLKSLEVAKRRRIESQIETLSAQRDSLTQTLEGQRQYLDELTRTLDNQNAELEEYKASIERYMSEHLPEVSAIALGLGGANIAVDKDNVFTDEAKASGRLMEAIGAIWALVDMKDIAAVAGALNEADAVVHTKETAISGTASAIQQQKITIEGTQSGIERLTQQVDALQKELDK